MGRDARIPMIGWLQGELAEPWQRGHRCGALVRCQGVGYEVQLSERHWRQLPQSGAQLTLHVHQTIRDDGWTLYGFADRQERDLFRELVAVSGVGPQMGLGLLGTMDCGALVRAIVQGDLRQLTQAPGVGKRTAERLAVDLRRRLQERFLGIVDDATELDGLGGGAMPAGDDVQITLAALGYEPLEIQRALRAVASMELQEQEGAEAWIRAALRWLSRPAA